MSADRCYLRADVCRLLNLSKRSFFQLRKEGRLTMLEELQPRIGNRARYRSGPVDRYLAGQFARPRSFASHRKSA